MVAEEDKEQKKKLEKLLSAKHVLNTVWFISILLDYVVEYSIFIHFLTVLFFLLYFS